MRHGTSSALSAFRSSPLARRIEIDGARFGPLGRAGAVVSNVLLDPQAVRRVFPNAASAAASPAASAARPVAAAAPPSNLQSAAAGLPRP
jgi:hypothetical protein